MCGRRPSVGVLHGVWQDRGHVGCSGEGVELSRRCECLFLSRRCECLFRRALGAKAAKKYPGRAKVWFPCVAHINPPVRSMFVCAHDAADCNSKLGLATAVRVLQGCVFAGRRLPPFEPFVHLNCCCSFTLTAMAVSSICGSVLMLTTCLSCTEPRAGDWLAAHAVARLLPQRWRPAKHRVLSIIDVNYSLSRPYS